MTILRSQIFIISILIVSILIIIFIISYFECKNYKIKHYRILNNKNDAHLRLIYISDFHNKMYRCNNDKLIKDILSQKSDYIFLGGDLIDFSALGEKFNVIKYENAISFLEKLSKSLAKNNENSNYNLNRIFLSFGNHELRLKDSKNENLNIIFNEIIKEIESFGICILDNITFDLNENYTVSGMSLYKGYYANKFSRHKKHKSIDKEIFNKYYGNLDRNKFNIMLFHKPDYIEDFIDYGFDLVLSGHNHGGLIKFNGGCTLFSPDFDFMPKYNYGLYGFKGSSAIVTSGLGEHMIRIRVNNRPEFVVVDING